MKRVALIFSVLFMSGIANADCTCACVGGQKQWVCANKWDTPAGYCGGYCQGYAPDDIDLNILKDALEVTDTDGQKDKGTTTTSIESNENS